ncbi:hypothetical protein H4696_000237 [Amycolatopsis lexingtonensis]|uniref:Uncharacterized protein n=1 Tax=Amycolatopsis lexingtonensis TaxID=218822 RepID=A0ABR9HQC8_9PSEU|nr:hypothetical protein [Amycolatopsis lexingtonensis]MBE1493137.1 hypothetical protein [Amycolatopsis lexingtonensis]
MVALVLADTVLVRPVRRLRDGDLAVEAGDEECALADLGYAVLLGGGLAGRDVIALAPEDLSSAAAGSCG